MRQVVCISTTHYYPIPTRKQNVLNRLSDAEIIYIDPPVTWIAPLKDKNCKERLTKWKQPGEKVQDNVTVYAAPPVLPFFNKYRFINKINQKRIARYVRKRMQAHGMEKISAWRGRKFFLRRKKINRKPAETRDSNNFLQISENKSIFILLLQNKVVSLQR